MQNKKELLIRIIELIIAPKIEHTDSYFKLVLDGLNACSTNL